MPRRRPAFNPVVRAALAAAAALAVTACGGGDDPTPPPAEQPLACLSLPAITWHRSATASADWNDVAVDRRNHVWLGGWAEGDVGRERLDPSGNSRAVLRQLAPDGTVLWDSRAEFDTPGTDTIEALAFAPQGRVVVAGRTTGSIDGRANAGQFDAFIAWNDAANPLSTWKRVQSGTARPEHPRRVQVAGNGTVHLAGWDDEYVPTNYVEAWQDPIALRFAPQASGYALAGRHQGNSEVPDSAEALHADAAGNSYIGGATQSGRNAGAFLRKIDAAGTVLWTARYTVSGADNLVAIRPQPDGTLLIAGSVFGSFRGGAHQGQQDVFVARVAADDGRVLASWQYGSSGSEWLTDMNVDAHGRILLLGETDGALVPGQANAGGTDLFVLRLASDGSVLGRSQWGTAAEEMARRVANDSCGNVVATGASTAAEAGALRRAGVLWFLKF
jgi:hypothetical protein